MNERKGEAKMKNPRIKARGKLNKDFQVDDFLTFKTYPAGTACDIFSHHRMPTGGIGYLVRFDGSDCKSLVPMRQITVIS